MSNTFRILYVNGHYEVLRNGKFFCSADTYTEAIREIDEEIFRKDK